MPSPALAIDFGTSNSAAAELVDGRVRRLAIETGAETLPTAVFFPAAGGLRIGTAAAEALVAGEDGLGLGRGEQTLSARGIQRFAVRCQHHATDSRIA